VFQALLAKDAKVYIAARDEEKTTRAIAALKRETAREARFVHLDLADLRSIKKAAAEFSRYGLLLVVVCS
jgi:retinol dehydrogenase-12